MLTRSGRLALLGAVLLYVGAVATGWLELAVLATVAVVAVVAAALWVLPQPALSVEREVQPTRVQVGKVAMAMVRVTNDGHRTSPAVVGRESIGTSTMDVPIPRLAPGATRTQQYRLPTERRGIIDVGPFSLVRADALGLAERGAPRGDVATLWVHPRTYAIGPLPSGLVRDIEGPTSDTSPKGTVAFHSLREYVPGDDHRLIHWRTSARLGTLLVRHQVDVAKPDTTLVLDVRPQSYADEERFEAAVEVIASVAVAATERLFPTRLVTTGGDDQRATPGRDGARLLLDHLAGLQPASTGGLADAAGRLRSDRGGGSLVVVTGGLTGGELDALSAVQRRYVRTVVVSIHPEGEIHGGAPAGVTVIHAPDGPSFASAWMSHR